MSSTTDRSRGQALAVFALSLTAVLMAAALAFDAGLLYVERRDQQNAADAAAIAGARYLTSSTAVARQDARDAATEIATLNGFTNGSSAATVAVDVPPTTGPNAGRNGFIEVRIGATRPSIFAGIMGILDWDVSARAVALNGDGSGGDFAILALDPSACPALDVTGSGSILAYGNIQVNSSCTSNPQALRVSNNGSIVVDLVGGSCDVVGNINGDPECVQPPDAQVMPDPLSSIEEPATPTTPAPAALSLDDPQKDIPEGCPDSGSDDAATIAEPALCRFGSSLGGTWRLYPGLYPGGLEFQAGTFYLEPGIYWIGGGGVDASGGGADLISVPSGGTSFCSTPEQECGVMIFNSELSDSPAGDVHLNGGDADVLLHPIDDDVYGGIVFFQDRDLDPQPELQLNGGSTDMQVRGTVYVPGGYVRANGNEGDLITDQVIADTFSLNGNEGEITALKAREFIYRLGAAGLVE